MATSLIAKPQSITTAYNPVKYIYDSTNKNEDGFRYIYDIYNSGGTKIAEYRLLPNIDGYGEIDLSRLLQNYVSFDFDDSITSSFDAINSYYEYEVRVGEEYIEDVSYTASLTQNGTYTTITATHAFQVGDQVVITQVSPGTDNPNLEGLHTVTSINTTVDFTVNALWSEITDATIDGTVSYADNRKTVTRDIVTVSSVYVTNGAFGFTDWTGYLEANYILDGNKDFFWTYAPRTFNLTLDQDLWTNFGTNNVATGYCYFENSTGDIFRKTVTASGLISQVSVGCNNFGTLALVSGSGSLIEDDVDYYDYWYANSAGTQHSTKYRINIDRRCKINDYEIAFLDRLGSIGSFAFQLRDKLTGSVTKETYNQHIEGSVASSTWGYELTAQGQKVINPTIKETYNLETNWMNEDDASYFTQLVSSPQTWIKIGGTYYSCIVEDKGYEKERQRNKNLIRKSLKVSLSVQDVVNG